MKTKPISLALASLLSVQSIAFANPDRTEGIGNQAIATAKNNFQSISSQILLLDQTLEKTQEAILKRENRGDITNGLAVAGAAIGLGISAVAYTSLKKGTAASSINGLALGLISIVATVSSLIPGGTSQALKPAVNLDDVERSLTGAQNLITATLAQDSAEKSSSVFLTQLNLSIKNTHESLAMYKEQENDVTRNRLVSQATQLVGSAMLVYGLTHRDTNNLLLYGALVMNAGNIGALLSGLQNSEAELVLKEIAKTRESLKLAASLLQ